MSSFQWEEQFVPGLLQKAGPLTLSKRKAGGGVTGNVVRGSGGREDGGQFEKGGCLKPSVRDEQ